MNAKELRIGNITKQGVVVEINRSDKDSFRVWDVVNLKSSYNNNVEPIPLTEEWLIKFGFSKESPDNEDDFNYWELKDVEFTDYEDGDFEINQTGFVFKYVHQLQNLYFALTGEELELKEVTNE